MYLLVTFNNTLTAINISFDTCIRYPINQCSNYFPFQDAEFSIIDKIIFLFLHIK